MSLKSLAKQRIEILFKQAEKTNDLKLANRYVFLARKIAQKTNTRIPKKFKRKFCKHCYHYFIPSKNSRVRTNKNKVLTIFCFNCKKRTRIPFNKKKSKVSAKHL